MTTKQKLHSTNIQIGLINKAHRDIMYLGLPSHLTSLDLFRLTYFPIYEKLFMYINKFMIIHKFLLMKILSL